MPGLGLIHKVLSSGGSMGDLLSAGLSQSDFVGDESSVYRMVEEHFSRYGSLPQLRTIEAECGVRMSGFPDEPLEYWVDRVRIRTRRSAIISAADEAKNLAQSNRLEEAQSVLQNLIIQADGSLFGCTDLRNLVDLFDRVAEDHDKRRRQESMAGVPFGIDFLDKVSDGGQPGDAVALVGRPSEGKSYLLFRMALSAWEADRVPMIVSMEMSSVPVARRIIAMKSKLPTSLIRKGSLSFLGRSHLARNIAELTPMFKDRPFYLLAGSLDLSVEDLILQVKVARPNALYVDGAYLLKSKIRSSSRWERVADTAEVLKRLGMSFGIPVISTYQFNRRGPGSLGNIAGSDTIGQLGSIVLSLDSGEESEAYSASYHTVSYKNLELIKGREGEKGTIRLLFDFRRSIIAQDSVISGDDSSYMVSELLEE